MGLYTGISQKFNTIRDTLRDTIRSFCRFGSEKPEEPNKELSQQHTEKNLYRSTHQSRSTRMPLETRHKQAGFNRVLDGLAKRQLQHDFQLEKAAETYEPIRNIGAGAFGIVCEAIETTSETKVAIKKIGHASATPTLARRTLREIRVLRFINHENIVTLRDIFRTQGPLGIDVYLVMDLMDGNLHYIIHGDPEPIDEELIMSFLCQLLRGLLYLHKAQIAHRDLKPSNLLVNRDCTLRIADFGMAKLAEKDKVDEAEEHCFYMTQHVATLPYRAPELLFVMPEHSTAVDMWAVGCIYAEMILKRELFPGRSVQGQIKILVSVFGQPSEKVLNEIRCSRTRNLIETYKGESRVTWNELLYTQSRQGSISCDAVDFASRLIEIDADKRMTIEEAINHRLIKNSNYRHVSEPSCPFRVKKDMADVENMNHQQLSDALCNDVKSAENGYTTGTYSEDFRKWRPGQFKYERDNAIGQAQRAIYEPHYFYEGPNRSFGSDVSAESSRSSSSSPDEFTSSIADASTQYGSSRFS